MGIPIFITPTEPEVAIKAVEKTAARSRSSIRRLRTVEPPHIARRFRMLARMAALRSPEDYDAVEPPGQEGSPPTNQDATSSLHPFSSRYRSEYERTRLRDQLSSDDDSHLLLPPAPESHEIQTRFEVMREMQRRQRENNAVAEARQRQELRRLARTLDSTLSHVETEPIISSTSEQRPTSEERRSILTSTRSSSRPRHENLHPVNNRPSRYEPTVRSRSISESIDALNRARETYEAADRDVLAERVAALNRATDSFEARRRARQARLDGLGDRDRSWSPDGTEGNWNTLVSGITPDPQPPSAGSSFASSAAAAASSSASVPVSATTSMTSLNSTSESTYANINDFCEGSDSASGTEEEDEEEGGPFDPQGLSRSNRNPVDRSYANALLAGHAAHYDHPTGAEHWEGMQLIISRLTEREDIPESFWAQAGLSRNLRREPSS